MNEVELERLIVRLVGDGSSYSAMLSSAVAQSQAAAAQVQGASAQIEGFSSSLLGFAKNAVMQMAMLSGAFAGIGFVQNAVKMAAEAESLTVSFGTMLGSAAAGEKMVQDLIQLAAKTPLTLPGVLHATQTLLQFGVEGDRVIRTVRMIGDVVGGDEARLHRMALVFGQMRAAGRLMGQDLLQMINAGFNPLQEMSRTTGRSMEDLRAAMEKGQISVQMVTEAFRSASGEGGRFEGLMEKQSKTLTGLWSTMKDDIGGLMRAVGGEIMEGFQLKEVVKAVSSTAQSIVDLMKAVPDEIRVILAWLTKWGAAIIATILIVKVLGVVVAFVTAQIGAMTVGLARMFVTLATNPVGLAVIALVAMKMVVWDNLQAVKDLNREMERSQQTGGQWVRQLSSNARTVNADLAVIEDPMRRGTATQAALTEAETAQARLQGVTRDLERQIEYIRNQGGDQNMVANSAARAAGQPIPRMRGTRVVSDILAAVGGSSLVSGLTPAQENLAQTRVALERQTATVQDLRDAMSELNRDRLAEKATHDLQNFNNRLEDQAETFGMSTEWSHLYTQAMRGADLETVMYTADLIRQREELEYWAEVTKEAARITERFRDPLLKFQERLDQLDMMLEMEMITLDVYNNALEDAANQLDRTGRSAHKAADEIMRFDAAAAGSAEAVSRLQAAQFAASPLQLQREAGARGGIYQGQAPADRAPRLNSAEGAQLEADRERMIEILNQIAANTGSAARRPGVVIRPGGGNLQD